MINHKEKFVKNPKHQRGVVLFIAMVALVVMSLAAVALIRSVDTNSLITGNLSFKQTSIASSSYGIESLSDYLATRDLSYGEVNDPGNGYYAVCTTTQSNPATPCDGVMLTNQATWQTGATSRLADGLEVTGGQDAYGNRIEYIVERMCTSVGEPKDDNCLLARRANKNGSQGIENETRVGGPETAAGIPVYRVTVRVTGPKNTTSYVQAFIS